MFSDVPSLRNNTCAQVFVTANDFSRAFPMKTKAEAGEKLNLFVQTHGIMETLVTDGAKEEFYGTWNEVRKKYLIYQRQTEPYSPWQNKAESEIRELKNHFRRLMNRNKVPERLWDFGLEYTSCIHAYTARANLDDRTPDEILKGETPDISEYIQFEFYQWIKYYDPAGFPIEQEKLGRWLGPAHDVGQALCYWILKDNGQVLVQSSVRPLTPEETRLEPEITLWLAFDNAIKEMVGEFEDELILANAIDEFEEERQNMNHEEGIAGQPPGETGDEERIVTGNDPLIHANIFLPKGDRSELATVKDRKRNADGLLIGRKHRNPMLDSRIYIVQFPDGETRDVSYNTLAEHLFSQVDSEGNQYQLFREIINHRKNK